MEKPGGRKIVPTSLGSAGLLDKDRAQRVGRQDKGGDPPGE
jgi:hypothetical protein